MTKRRVILAGKHRIATTALEALAADPRVEVAVVPVASDEGRPTWQPSLRAAAEARGVPILTLDEVLRFQDFTFLSLEYDRIVDPARFPRSTLLNLHFSLLPAYRGCFTSIWPILNGERESGVTLHEIDPGIDTGPVIDQLRIPIDESTTSRSLYEAYQDAGAELLRRNLEGILANRLESRAQPVQGATYYSRGSLGKVSRELDPRATAFQVARFVAALFFPEYQTALFQGRPIAAARPLAQRSKARPGTILEDAETRVVLATIDHDVELLIHRPAPRA